MSGPIQSEQESSHSEELKSKDNFTYANWAWNLPSLWETSFSVKSLWAYRYTTRVPVFISKLKAIGTSCAAFWVYYSIESRAARTLRIKIYRACSSKRIAIYYQIVKKRVLKLDNNFNKLILRFSDSLNLIFISNYFWEWVTK